jgi:hypothetical protein
MACPCTHQVPNPIPLLDPPSIPSSPAQHTIAHVLFTCPRYCGLRLEAFGHGLPLHLPNVLSTFAGGFALGGFLWSTQDLLFPLDTPNPNFWSPLT